MDAYFALCCREWLGSQHTRQYSLLFYPRLLWSFTGFFFTLFINPRIKDVEELNKFKAMVETWKIDTNIQKLTALEVKFSEEVGRNLPTRADNVEAQLTESLQRISKLEGAEAERNKRMEEGLQRFQGLIDKLSIEISEQVNQGDESNVVSLLKVQEVALDSAMKLARIGDRDAEKRFEAELESVRAELRRRSMKTSARSATT